VPRVANFSMSPIFTIALGLGRFEAIDARGTVKRITARGEIKHFVMAITPKFAEGEGFRFLQTFTETDSGADDDRPELTAAIERARKAKAPVVVAKLDRLSRDVHFISALMKHQVPFIVTELGRGYRSLSAPHLRGAGQEGAQPDPPAHEGRASRYEGARRQNRWPA